MRRQQRGSVFVLSLVVLAGLVAILASVASTQRTEVRAQLNRSEAARARLTAHAALQHAMAVLAENATLNATQPTTLQDEWATLGDRGTARFVLGAATYRMEIIDASSRINLNTAPLEQLQRLPLTQEQIESLLDWREASQTPRPEGGKDEFYNNLSNPYNVKLRRFDTLDELLLVRGFLPEDLYEEQTDVATSNPLPSLPNNQPVTLAEIATVDSFSPQTRPDGTAKINVNANGVQAATLVQAGLPVTDATQIIQRRPAGGYPTLGDVAAAVNPGSYQVVLDILTTNAAPRAEGRLNLNTVSETVLQSLPNMTPDIAQAIVQRQGQGFEVLSDMLSIPGLNSVQALRDFANYFSVRSTTFIVRVLAQVGSTQYTIEATIDVQEENPRILKISQTPFNDMTTRWGWDVETTRETVLKEAE